MTLRIAPLAQGVFYVTSGLWPVIHLRSFERITGPKQDKWLVQTVGGLIAAIGSALLVGAVDKQRSRSIATLGVASAAVLAAADVYFVGKGRIPPVYLGDAAVEAIMIAAWTLW